MSGIIFRPGAGHHVYSDDGNQIAAALFGKRILLTDIYKKYPKDQIVEYVKATAKGIKETDIRKRSIEEIELLTWRGECAELATILALEEASIPTKHASRVPRSPWDIDALSLRIEVKAFPYNSKIKNEIRFINQHTYNTIGLKWNSFDIFLPVLWTDETGGVSFSDRMSFFFWKMIDSLVFWSELKMFATNGVARILDQETAISEQMLRNLT